MDAKRRGFFTIFFMVLVILIFFTALVKNASAASPEALLQNEKEDGTCSITEAEHGLFVPIRINADFHPFIKLQAVAIEQNNLEEKKDFNLAEGTVEEGVVVDNSIFNYGTNATDHIVVKMQFVSTQTMPDEIVTTRIIAQENFVHSIIYDKFGEDRTFCKVISIRTSPPPFIESDEDLARKIEEFHAVRFDNILATDLDQNDLLTILTLFVVVGFGVVGISILIMVIARRNDVDRFSKLAKKNVEIIGMLRNARDRIDFTLEHITTMFGMMESKITKTIGDVGMSYLHIKKIGDEKIEEKKKRISEKHGQPKDLSFTRSFFEKTTETIKQKIPFRKEEPELVGEEKYFAKYEKNSEKQNRENYETLLVEYKKDLDNDELRLEIESLRKVIEKQIMERKHD